MIKLRLLETLTGEDGTQTSTIMSGQILWDSDMTEMTGGKRMHLTHNGVEDQGLGPDQLRIATEASFLLANAVSVTRLDNTRVTNALTARTLSVQFAGKRDIAGRLVPKGDRLKKLTKR